MPPRTRDRAADAGGLNRFAHQGQVRRSRCHSPVGDRPPTTIRGGGGGGRPGAPDIAGTGFLPDSSVHRALDRCSLGLLRRRDRGPGMGVVINPRGTGGAGKTEFARRILAEYGWRKDGQVEPIHRDMRRWPIGYRLRHPLGRRPLVVLGHYERTSGGCDTFSARDGGLDEAFRLADAWASAGHDVLIEGSALSAEHERSASLARRHTLHVVRLATPPEQAARNLVARWRARRDRRSLVAGGPWRPSATPSRTPAAGCGTSPRSRTWSSMPRSAGGVRCWACHSWRADPARPPLPPADPE
jgi:hypothetical protein